MLTNKKQVENYPIPFKTQSGYKWTFHLLIIFLIVIFLGFVLIPLGKDIEVILLKILFAIIGAFYFYIWLFTGVLKKQYFELTEDNIRIKALFRLIEIRWNQIYDVQVFTQSHNTILGIVLKEKVRKRKETFWNLINDMYGGMFTVRIAFSQYPHIDIERLYSTITDRLIKANENSSSNLSDNIDSYSVKPEEDIVTTNIMITLLKLTLLSIGIGLGYGFSIFLIKANIVIIPIFGSMAILYFYSKLYKEEKINVLIRILIGLICTIQVFIGVIVTVILESKFSINIHNIIYLTRQYFEYLIKHPLDQGIIIFIAILCFGYGAFQGYKFKFQRKIEKIFMKKAGKYYYKREGRIVSIYLKDPVRFNKQDEGMLVAQISKDCLIEKEKKRVKGLYIPVKDIDGLEIVINYDECIEINNIMYYKIDLNSDGNYEQYVFPCSMIMNSKKEVELIQIEL